MCSTCRTNGVRGDASGAADCCCAAVAGGLGAWLAMAEGAAVGRWGWLGTHRNGWRSESGDAHLAGTMWNPFSGLTQGGKTVKILHYGQFALAFLTFNLFKSLLERATGRSTTSEFLPSRKGLEDGSGTCICFHRPILQQHGAT